MNLQRFMLEDNPPPLSSRGRAGIYQLNLDKFNFSWFVAKQFQMSLIFSIFFHDVLHGVQLYILSRP